MSISTDILAKDAATLIANGIKADLEKQIYKELMEYIQPQIKQMAAASAHSVTENVLIHIGRNVERGDIEVMVRFGELK